MLPDDCNPASAAAVSPQVFEFGGRTFVLSPIQGADAKAHGLALHAEFRRQCMASAKDPLSMVNDRIAAAEKSGKPLHQSVISAMVEAAMSAATREEGKTEPTDAEIVARANTLAGSQFLVWLRLRKCDPSVTRAWVAEHMPDMDTRNDVFARIMEVDGMASLDPKKATATG